MRYTVIDIGSNTVKYSLFSVRKETYTIKKRASEAVRLIGYIENGKLSEEGLEKLCDVLGAFREEALAAGCVEERIFAFATASLRRIDKPQSVIAALEKRMGLKVVLLSGEEEARCSFLGMLSAAEEPPESGVMLDMGGGSTEIHIFGDSSYTASLPFGALSLKNSFGVGRDLDADTERALRAYVSGAVPPEARELGEQRLDAYPVGGTARACAKLAKIFLNKDGPLTRAEFSALTALVSQPDDGRYETLRALFPDRFMLLSSGCTAFDELFRALGVGRVVFCTGGIREGYLLLRTGKNLKEKKN